MERLNKNLVSNDETVVTPKECKIQTDNKIDQACDVNKSNQTISKTLKYFIEDLDNVCILGKIYPKPLGIDKMNFNQNN
jgi:hypothetical protein